MKSLAPYTDLPPPGTITDGQVSTTEADQDQAGRGFRVPNGGLYSSLGDMTRWLRFQMSEPSPSVFDKDALAEAQSRITLSGPRLRGGYGISSSSRT